MLSGTAGAALWGCWSQLRSGFAAMGRLRGADWLRWQRRFRWIFAENSSRKRRECATGAADRQSNDRDAVYQRDAGRTTNLFWQSRREPIDGPLGTEQIEPTGGRSGSQSNGVQLSGRGR